VSTDRFCEVVLQLQDTAFKRPSDRDWYTDRGLLLGTRLGGPDGEIVRDGVHNALCETCRVLMARGITGSFEAWKVGIPYACILPRSRGLPSSRCHHAVLGLPGSESGKRTPDLRMPFPVRASQRQRARTTGTVGGSRRHDRAF
jgi:hypothetical protein